MSKNRDFVLVCRRCMAKTWISTDSNGRLVEIPGVCTCKAVVENLAVRNDMPMSGRCEVCGGACRSISKRCVPCGKAVTDEYERARSTTLPLPKCGCGVQLKAPVGKDVRRVQEGAEPGVASTEGCRVRDNSTFQEARGWVLGAPDLFGHRARVGDGVTPVLERLETLHGTTFAYACGSYSVRLGRLCHALPLIEDHHYTGRRTADPMFVFLLCDASKVHATVVYTAPVNRYFGKGATELARLVRLPELAFPLSQFVASTLRWLAKNTLLLYCLSYADSTAGHHGGIYQALNFTHVAVSRGHSMYRHRESGRLTSARAFDQRAASNKIGWERIRSGPKYLYVYPLRRKGLNNLLARFGWTPLPFPKPLLNLGAA